LSPFKIFPLIHSLNVLFVGKLARAEIDMHKAIVNPDKMQNGRLCCVYISLMLSWAFLFHLIT